MNGAWQPIQTAYKDRRVLDGERVLIGWDTGQTSIAIWDGNEWHREIECRPGKTPSLATVCGMAPTHWQPLVPPGGK